MNFNFYTTEQAYVSLALAQGDMINLATLPRYVGGSNILNPKKFASMGFQVSTDGCDSYNYDLPAELDNYTGTVEVLKYNLSGNSNDYDLVFKFTDVTFEEFTYDAAYVKKYTGKKVVLSGEYMSDIYVRGNVTCSTAKP
jgi:hypothetical protein